MIELERSIGIQKNYFTFSPIQATTLQNGSTIYKQTKLKKLFHAETTSTYVKTYNALKSLSTMLKHCK